jgi:hypothetical protein
MGLFQKFLGGIETFFLFLEITDYGRPEKKLPSLHGRKFNPNPKFLGTLESGINVGPTFINFGSFSRPYGLIREYIKVI